MKPKTPNPTLSLLAWMAGLVRTPRLRSLLEFAEAKIVVPDGPHKGERFRAATQPWAGLYLAELGSGRWPRSALVGCTQGGKSFIGYVVPTCWHLFEHGENVVMGVPDANMANDKWTKDMRPVIAASFQAELPVRGPGSRHGAVKDSVTFGCGSTLKFMTGGSGDAGRSGYTTRVTAMTEVDKMDEASETSRETDPVSQIEARADAFGDRARHYKECTPSFENGRIWTEYTHGTRSRIACPCPHCQAWVTPEREHLVGWQQAESEEDARERARWVCPACGSELADAERAKMNRQGLLVHRGQEVLPDGRVDGDLPRTRTFGLRFNAFNNLFWTAADVGARSWRASRMPNSEAAERAIRQFVWALPAQKSEVDLAELDAQVLLKRTTDDPRGWVPDDCEHLTVGVDIGKRLLHWVAIAFRAAGSPHVVEYGRQEVAIDAMLEDRALLAALRDFRDKVCVPGWPSADGQRQPDMHFVDAGWKEEIMLAFCRESGPLWLACKGTGATQYRHPTELGRRVSHIGDAYHIARLPKLAAEMAHLNSDEWKANAHARLRTPMGQAGALTLYHVDQANDHLAYVKHLLAERQKEIASGRHGYITIFEQLHRNNHWLDSTSYALAAGHYAGARVSGLLDDVAGGVETGSWWSARRRR